MLDPTSQYALKVVHGEIVAGPYVRLACQRHLDDLERDDLFFDTAAAERIFNFFRKYVRLAEGVREGKAFELFDWQEFVLGSLFGWFRVSDGRRRFRRAYIETAKGSGKSPLSAVVIVYSILGDREKSAKSFVIARNADQALVPFAAATDMIRVSPALAKRLIIRGGLNPWQVTHLKSNSWMRRVSSEKLGKGKSGPMPHMVLADEYHEHDSSNMLDFYTAGMKSRKNPLAIIITNAGAGMNTPCGAEHNVAVQIVEGSVVNDSYFAYVCALDEDDDFMNDESCWIKANPSLPDLPGYDYIREQIAEARGMPSKESLVLRLNACEWTDAESPLVPRELWIKCETERPPEAEMLRDAPCYAAADLSMKKDLTAGALLWDLSEVYGRPRYHARLKIWTPEDSLEQRAADDGVDYRTWAKQGHIDLVPGRLMNYAPVAEWLREAMAENYLRGLAFDQWMMDLLKNNLALLDIEIAENENESGLWSVRHSQSWKAGTNKFDDDEILTLWMPRSIDAVEKMILEGTLTAEKNPALRWAVLGAVAVGDASANRRFEKIKSNSRIDAMVALTMAAGFSTAFDVKVDPIAEYYKKKYPVVA